MDLKSHEFLLKLESFLFISIFFAMITEVWSSNMHPVIFVISTIVLITGMLGIILIELIKLQRRQKNRR